jgi:conjugal transfer/entry exclusion protein
MEPISSTDNSVNTAATTIMIDPSNTPTTILTVTTMGAAIEEATTAITVGEETTIWVAFSR